MIMFIKDVIRAGMILWSLVILTHTKSKTAVREAPLLTLERHNDKYLLNLKVNLHKVSLQAILSNQNSYLKDNQCKVCKQSITICEDPCFTTDQYQGIHCNSPSCQFIQDSSQQIDSTKGNPNILSSRQISINSKIQSDKTQYVFNIALVFKMKHQNQYDGVVSIFEDQMFEWALLTMDKDENIIVYNKMFNTNSNEPLSLPQTSDFIKIQKNSIELQQNSSEQDLINILSCKTLKLTNRQYESINKVEINTPNTSLQITLNQSTISLPQSLFNSFASNLQDSYFKDKECVIRSKLLECTTTPDLTKLFHAKLEFHVGDNIISLPFRALFLQCKSTSCKIMVQSSPSENTIFIGSFIFNIFAVEYQLQQNYIIFHRLENQWSKYYNSQKIDVKREGFAWTMILISYHAFRYILKAIFYLAALSILINCIIQRRKLMKWISKIYKKITHKNKSQNHEKSQVSNTLSEARNRLPLFSDDEEEEEEII